MLKLRADTPDVMVAVIVATLAALALTLLFANRKHLWAFREFRRAIGRIPDYHRRAVLLLGHTWLFPMDPSKFFSFITELVEEEQKKGESTR